VFFMPGADGPCRFGQYSQYHRIILDELGYKDVPIYSPNSRTSYTDFGPKTTEFRKIAWNGIVFVDCLIKLLLQCRPYELQTGHAERIYYKYLHRMDKCILEDRSLHELAAEAGEEFQSLRRVDGQKPVIGLVGEIYLRNNRFSNNHLITKLEALGAEVKLASFAEWIHYTSYTYRLDSIYKKQYKNTVKAYLQETYQHRTEHKIEKSFSRGFPLEHDTPVTRVIAFAAPYLPVDIRGEAVLSIGKAIDFVQKGASGIVNCMPFNCMPGTIVTSLSRKISNDLGDTPWLNISYEGLQDTGEETRIEAFFDQVKSCHAHRGEMPYVK
ncbi:MAG: hypothetical protein JSV44_03405, partial [Candidatus Zixiibacteriota bacterium]